MAVKTDTEVIIGGSVLTLSGYESEEYLQKVASYINNKLSEYAKVEGFRRQPIDKQHILLEINIADDYFKAKERIAALEDDVAAKEKELYNVTHDLTIPVRSCVWRRKCAIRSARKRNRERGCQW